MKGVTESEPVPETRLGFRTTVWLAVSASALLATFLWSCGSKSSGTSDLAALLPAAVPADSPYLSADPVERGAFLVEVGACNDCHTPWKMTPNGPEPDWTRLLSGHPQGQALAAARTDDTWQWAGAGTNTAYFGPWGISYAANLTPDVETGTGAWTAEMFVASIKTGKHWGTGREIMPPMPWFAYRHYPEEDLKAIFAYLQSIPPIKNEVPLYTSPEKLLAAGN